VLDIQINFLPSSRHKVLGLFASKKPFSLQFINLTEQVFESAEFWSSRCRQFLIAKCLRLAEAFSFFKVKISFAESLTSISASRVSRCTFTKSTTGHFSGFSGVLFFLAGTREKRDAKYARYWRSSCIRLLLEVRLLVSLVCTVFRASLDVGTRKGCSNVKWFSKGEGKQGINLYT